MAENNRTWSRLDVMASAHFRDVPDFTDSVTRASYKAEEIVANAWQDELYAPTSRG
jgi:hypothetical protein